MFYFQDLLDRGGGGHDLNDLPAPSPYTMHRTARYYQVRIKQTSIIFYGLFSRYLPMSTLYLQDQVKDYPSYPYAWSWSGYLPVPAQ